MISKRDGSVDTSVLDIERKVARCRMLLSVFAIAAAALAPTDPIPFRSSPFSEIPIEVPPLVVLGAHLGFSIAVYGSLSIALVPRAMLVLTTCCDLLFSVAIALVTRGAVSAFYVFFAFAIVAAGVRGGFRLSMGVTALSVWLYLCLIFVTASRTRHVDAYLMLVRPAYLTIVGYLVAYLGQLRMNLESTVRGLERAKERDEIARALHDGCVQALAGTNLILGSCRELVQRGRAEEAVAVLTELQTSITREYDGLRSYVRKLTSREAAAVAEPRSDTRFTVNAQFSAAGMVAEHVLQIILEGVRNVRRHAVAPSASIEARTLDSEIRINIEDDGRGFPDGAPLPWSISSHVKQLGGQIQLSRDRRSGAHLRIALKG
jgi:signal transduction histidine kinase